MAGQNKGYFIPTTQSYDFTQLKQMGMNSDRFIEFLVMMSQQINNLSQQVNSKAVGFYNTQEFATGETFFPNPSISSGSTTNISPRAIFRKVVSIGPLPNAATSPKTVAHGISFNANTTLVKFSGAATDPSALNMIPLPYTSGSVPTAAVSISLTSTDIVIRVSPASDYTMYTRAYVIIEFIKN